MKLLFIQKSGLPWHGIMSMSAYLKSNGHDVDLILTDEERKPINRIKSLKPDFVGLPIITGEHEWAFSIAREIKEATGCRIIVGGPHSTFYPETIPPFIDHTVRGEGELPILDILWGRAVNGLGKLVEDLDSLPMPDRTIYYQYPHLSRTSAKQFLTGRGCPYNCSFCSNHLLRELYKGKGKLIRKRAPEKVIQEILEVKSQWGLKTVTFTDDVFILDKTWLSKFLPMYKSEVNVPFICNSRYDTLDEDLIIGLKKAGCCGIDMGIESGNEFLRNEVLQKGNIPNSQILMVSGLVKKHGLAMQTYNIVGIPGETIKEALETVDLNTKIKPDFAACSFLIPYPKYRIASQYDGRIKIPDSIYRPLKGTDGRIVNLQTFFNIAVKYPRLLPIIKLLIKLPPNRLYRVFAALIYGISMSRLHKLSLIDMIRYARHIDPFRI